MKALDRGNREGNLVFCHLLMKALEYVNDDGNLAGLSTDYALE